MVQNAIQPLILEILGNNQKEFEIMKIAIE